jgi:predicted TIM-barrel fold metal-dependent hydrolase
MSIPWLLAFAAAQVNAPAAASPPIIDMHLHAMSADSLGPPGSSICAPYGPWPIRDPRRPVTDYLGEFTLKPKCARRLIAPQTTSEIRDQSLAALEQHNIVAVTSGPPEIVEDYRKRAPDRIIPAISFGQDKLPSVAELRALHANGHLKVIGEMTFQYAGIGPDDPRIEPYYALGEELDLPVAIHVGPGPPGISYFASPAMRMRQSNALALEEVLMRHPKLRLYVMHAGWPLGDEMIALMYAHPQVYVDTAVIDYAFPRAEFHAYQKRLVDAGFADRIMFGSDQMIWPDAVDAAIEGIETADFLSPQQKRDIFYNNAARFLRLSPPEMSAHRKR